MNRRNNRICTVLLLATMLLLGAAPLAQAIILHPAGQPDIATWTDRPPDELIAEWSSTASCVPVSRNCILTTRHQKGGQYSTVKIAGVRYPVVQIWNHPTADMRIVKIRANIAEFVELYDKTDESGKQIVIGGHGLGNGPDLISGNTTYGYEWGEPNTRELRFGTNRIENPVPDSNLPPYVSDILVADFDDLNRSDPTAYECIPAAHDSGGGWFIKDGAIWKLAGLTRAVENHYEEGHENDPEYTLTQTWFRDPHNPIRSDADVLDAVRISSYAQWVNENLPEPTPGDLTGDDFVNAADFAVLAGLWQSEDCHAPDWCLGADSEPDGDIDAKDLAHLVQYWLNPTAE